VYVLFRFAYWYSPALSRDPIYFYFLERLPTAETPERGLTIEGTRFNVF
jgi:hypothetical protein